MKKLISCMPMILLAVLLSACGGGEASPDLFGRVSERAMEQGSLQLTVLETGTDMSGAGCSGWSGWKFGNYASIVKELKRVKARPAEDFTAEKMTFPLYEISLPQEDGFDLFLCWTNGYLIDQQGKAYRFDYDFAKLAQGEWSHKSGKEGLNVFIGRYLTELEGRWLFDRLPQKEETSGPEGIKMEILSVEQGIVSVEIRNESSRDWMYGKYYHLEVTDGKNWYDAPYFPRRPLAFEDIGLILPAGESTRRSYSLEPWMPLPTGRYRVVAGGGPHELSAEFDMP